MRTHDPILTSLGIVLSRKRHLDNDFRLHIFLRQEGKIVSTIKGAQGPTSKLKSLIEPFTLADYQLYLQPHSLTGRILGGKLIHSHYKIRQDLAAFGVACQLCEMMELLFPFRAPAPDIFDILQMGFQSLQNSASPKIVWLWFTVNLLKSLGHGDKAAECAGFLQPLERERVSAFLADQRSSVPMDALTLSEVSIERAVRFMETQVNEHLPRELKSTGFEKILLNQ